MKFTTKCLIGLLAVSAGWLFAHSAALQAGQSETSVQLSAAGETAPLAVFPKSQWEFEPVMEGTEIRHDFVVENRGDAPLLINKVRPD